MPSDWTILREHHCDGRNVSVLAAATDADLAACKAHCLSRGYTGFTTWRGKAFFREAASAAALRSASKKCAGCDVYLAPAAGAAVAAAAPSLPPSAASTTTAAAAAAPPPKPKAKAKAKAKASTTKATPPPASGSSSSTSTTGGTGVSSSSSNATQQLQLQQQRLRREEEEAALLRAQLEALEAMSLGGGGGGGPPFMETARLRAAMCCGSAVTFSAVSDTTFRRRSVLSSRSSRVQPSATARAGMLAAVPSQRAKATAEPQVKMLPVMTPVTSSFAVRSAHRQKCRPFTIACSSFSRACIAA
eukprot:Rhum_TRINITY_DN14355_c1_g2::Rhum_TRINITY_DN14355_c1_g2_i1::g.82751::m.82751